MKPSFIIAALAILFIATVYLYFQNSSRDQYWKSQIKHYETVNDSLRQVVLGIDSRLATKDAILLQYMSSLDKTLEELNKENLKNREALKINFSKQDSMRLEFCRQMAALGQSPSDCKQP